MLLVHFIVYCKHNTHWEAKNLCDSTLLRYFKAVIWNQTHNICSMLVSLNFLPVWVPYKTYQHTSWHSYLAIMLVYHDVWFWGSAHCLSRKLLLDPLSVKAAKSEASGEIYLQNWRKERGRIVSLSKATRSIISYVKNESSQGSCLTVVYILIKHPQISCTDLTTSLFPAELSLLSRNQRPMCTEVSPREVIVLHTKLCCPVFFPF